MKSAKLMLPFSMMEWVRKLSNLRVASLEICGYGLFCLAGIVSLY